MMEGFTSGTIDQLPLPTSSRQGMSAYLCSNFFSENGDCSWRKRATPLVPSTSFRVAGKTPQKKRVGTGWKFRKNGSGVS